MANTTIRIKKSGVSGNVPGSLALGELAINYTDGLLYYANSTGVSSITANVLSNTGSLITTTGSAQILHPNKVTVAYTGFAGSQNASFVSSGSNTKGGVGYVDFLQANNLSGGANNTNKWFRLDSNGQLQIINSAYTTNIFNLTDSGVLTVPSFQNISLLSGGGGAITFADGTTQYTANAGSGGTTDTFARTQANSAYGQANVAFNQANAAFTQANNISSYANAQITITQGVDTTQNTNISSAQLFANGAFTAANAVNTYAYAAYASQNITAGFANASYTLANTVNVYSYSAYGFANAAFIQANNAYNKANSALSNTGGVLTGSLAITGSSSNIVVSQSATASDVTNTFNHLYTLGLFSGNTDQSIQVGAQNFANTANSSTDFALYNNIGTDSSNYIDLGITSKAYNTTLNGFTASQPGDGYLYSNGVNLLLGTYTPGTNMKVFIGGYTSANVSTTFNAPNTASSSNTSGTLLVQGGVGVTGNVYSDKIYTNGLYYAANGNPISTGGGGGTSLVYTAATTPPASGNNKGDQWYNTATNVLYEWATDGTSYFWLDTISPVYSNTANVNIITSGNVNTNVVFANSVYIGTQNANSYIQSYIQQNMISPLMFVGL